jgi:hypothetical protein
MVASLISVWLLANEKEDVPSMIYCGDTTYSIWNSLREQLFPNIEANEAQLKNALYSVSREL